MKRLDWGQPKGPEDWEYVYRALQMIREQSFRTEQSDTDIATLQDDVTSLEAGNIPTINLTGGQITFPATQAASSGANVLDDYEENTFTPGIAFGGGTTGVTYASKDGEYTKIGRLVTFSLRIVLSSNGSSTGSVTLTGLPFTSAATYYHACALKFNGVVTGGADTSPAATIAPSSTSISLFTMEGGVVAAMTEAYIADDADIICSGAYIV